MFEFKDGIYMLSLLRCLEKGNISIDDVEQWKNCYKKNTGYSFREPYLKLKDKISSIHEIIIKCYTNFKFNDEEKEVIDNFLDNTIIESFEKISSLLDKLEKCSGIQIQRPDKVEQEDLKKLMTENLQGLINLWSKFWKDHKNDEYLSLSDDIIGGKYMLRFIKDGCFKKKKSFLNDIISGTNLMRNAEKVNFDFYVFRGVRESSSYNPENLITNLLLGKNVTEEIPTLYSTAWRLNSAINWTHEDYCCLYVIKVPKDSNYLIVDNAFKPLKGKPGYTQGEDEITLGPGKIVFDKIAILDAKYTQRLGMDIEQKILSKSINLLSVA